MKRWTSVGNHQLDFSEFYRGAADECLRAVLVSIGDQDTARELVDEAFARAWASWRTVSQHPAPEAWVVRTALNAGTGVAIFDEPGVGLPVPSGATPTHGGAPSARPSLSPVLTATNGPLAVGLVYASQQCTG